MSNVSGAEGLERAMMVGWMDIFLVTMIHVYACVMCPSASEILYFRLARNRNPCFQKGVIYSLCLS